MLFSKERLLRTLQKTTIDIFMIGMTFIDTRAFLARYLARDQFHKKSESQFYGLYYVCPDEKK